MGVISWAVENREGVNYTICHQLASSSAARHAKNPNGWSVLSTPGIRLPLAGR